MNRRNIATGLLEAIVIGTLLNMINSYDVFLDKRFTTRNVIKIILTYITPFCVSLYSSVKVSKQKVENGQQ
jgi:hypothetical protein